MGTNVSSHMDWTSSNATKVRIPFTKQKCVTPFKRRDFAYMELDAISYTKTVKKRRRNGLRRDWRIIDRCFIVGKRAKGVP